MENITLEKYSLVQMNPHFALQRISEICIAETHKLMVQGIGFEIVETQIKNTALTDDKGELLREIDLSQLGRDPYELKNLAMVKQNNLFLTPSYDQVAVSIYPDYRETALYIGSPPYLRLENLNAKKIIELGKEFQLSRDIIYLAYQQLAKNKEKALTILEELEFGSRVLKNKILQATKKTLEEKAFDYFRRIRILVRLCRVLKNKILNTLEWYF